MKIVKYIIVTFFGLLFLMPLWFMITGSFKSPIEIIARPPTMWPVEPILDAYKILFEFPLFLWLMNSLIVTVSSVLLSSVISLLAGYGFSKKEFPFKRLAFWLIMSTLFVPGFAIMVPLFLEIRALGLLGTRAGMIFPFLLSPMWIFFLRRYIDGIPNEYLLIADLDGASELKKFLYIVVPMTMPATATILVLGFVGAFQSILWPMIIARSESLFTLPVGLVVTIAREAMELEYLYRYSVRLAGATFMFVPMLIIFIIFQKYLVKGLYAGGIKE